MDNRIKTKVTVTSISKSFDLYTGKYLYTIYMEDDKNNRYKWSTFNPKDLKEGDVKTINAVLRGETTGPDINKPTYKVNYCSFE